MRLAPAVLVALLLAAPARAEEAVVTMPGKSFAPAQLTVVSGDEVIFRNADFSGDAHDVRDGAGMFASGPLPRFGAFRQRYDAVGEHPYVCSIHPGMAGSVGVVAALLEGPAQAALAGEAVTLRGRVPAGVMHADVERLQGGDWVPAGHGMAAPDGTFTAVVHPQEPSVYRAVTPAGASPQVAVDVLSGVRVSTRVRGRELRVRVTPAVGASVVLERYVRERFAWRRAGRVALRDGAARFRVPRRGLARVSVVRRGAALPLATSAPVRLRDGRPGHDPAAGDVPAGGHGGHTR